MDAKGYCGEISDENEEQVIGNWRKGHRCYKVAKNLAELCSSVLWKAGLANDETGNLAEFLSRVWKVWHGSSLFK